MIAGLDFAEACRIVISIVGGSSSERSKEGRMIGGTQTREGQSTIWGDSHTGKEKGLRTSISGERLGETSGFLPRWREKKTEQ